MVTPERDGRAIFKILKGVVNDGTGARLGTLSLPKRRPIDTPNFIGLTARGAVPHLTPDNVSRRSELGGVYIALEDCEYSEIDISSALLLPILTDSSLQSWKQLERRRRPPSSR
jgi:hypothetical protein